MPMLLECVSHTPVMGRNDPSPAVLDGVTAALAAARTEVEAFDPELIVLFAPDHWMGFFHKLMPSFCIGAVATSLGDYGTAAGPLPVPSDIAEACAGALIEGEIDIALSHRMEVDHGFVQPLEMVAGSLDRYPVLPIFINTLGKPRPTCRRSRLMGEAVGRFLAERHAGKRILVMGSGGLSHDPPAPMLATAPPEVRERLIAGGSRAADEQLAHEDRVTAAARAFTEADGVLGGGALLPLNPDWDRSILDALVSADFAALDAITDDEISVKGGRGGHEIRTWIAAFGCLSAFGRHRSDVRYYQAIPEWIAGFAIASGRSE